MACPHGSEPRPSSPPTFIVPVGAVVCALYGQDSIMCQYAKGGLGAVIPNAWVNTAEFCNSPPSPPDSLSITDFPTGWVSKAIELGKAQQWNVYCQCKPDPNQPSPIFTGGQCECIRYRVYYVYNFDDPYGERNSSIVLPGPIQGMRIVGSYNNDIQVSRGDCNSGGYTGQQIWTSIYNSGEIPLTYARISRVQTEDGSPDNCGNPPGSDPDNPPAPVIPPPPPLPPGLPPPPPPPQCIDCPPGPVGPPGQAGIKGDKGDKGEKGDIGQTGDIGPRGLPGVAGAKGDIGFQGPQGIQGATGASGADGSNGLPGPKGADGSNGVDGLPGPKGDQGLPGKAGTPGQDGKDAVIEYQNYEFEIHQCVDGNEQAALVQLPVIKPDLGESGVELFQAIFDNIYNRTRTLGCSPTANVAPAIIGSGVSSQLVRVFYTDIQPEVRSVILLITGDLPKGIKKYRLQGANEDECSFGYIGLATIAPDNSLASDQVERLSILTRATLYRIPQFRLLGKVRISLWQGLTWTMYDSGER